jgi:hypothetical protein
MTGVPEGALLLCYDAFVTLRIFFVSILGDAYLIRH